MKIDIYSSILDNTYKNIIDYRTLTDKDDNKINKVDSSSLFDCFNTLLNSYTDVNFNYGNFLNTSITISYSPIFSGKVPNYLKATPEKNTECLLSNINSKEPLYYFITNIINLTPTSFKLELELDVMTSFLHKLNFYTPINLERRHCERFGYAINDGKYFTYNRDCLIDNTSIEPNILKSVEDISYTYNYTDEKLSLVKTLKECKWLYLFLSNNIPLTTSDSIGQYFYQYKGENVGWQNYPLITSISTNVKLYTNFIEGVNASLPFLTLVFPVYTSINASDISSSVLTKGIEDVLANTSLTPYILSAKLSNKCPFTDSQIINNFQTSKSSRNYYLISDNSKSIFTDKTTYPIVFRGGRDYTLGFFIGLDLTTHTIIKEPYLRTFSSLPSVNDPKDIYLEPQFYTSKYSKQGIKLNNKELMIIEPFYAIQSNKPYTLEMEINEYNFTFLNYDTTTILYPYINTGLIQEGKTFINNSDWCIVNDNYQQAMANSKNSLYTGIETQITSSLTSSLLGMTKTPKIDDNGKIVSNIGGNVMSNAISGSMGIINNLNNFNAKLKDLEQTPNSIKIQGMDILNELTYFRKNSGIGKYVYYGLDETQMNIVYNYYYDYGYQVNKPYSFSSKIEYGSNVISRKLFNYIKINDDDFINKSKDLGVLPKIIKNKITSIFTEGFKLWEYIDCDSSFIKDYQFSNTNENIEIYDIKEI